MRNDVTNQTAVPAIERMSPARIAVLGIAAYLAVFIVAPVKVVTPQSLVPYIYMALSYFAFFSGCMLSRDQGRLPAKLSEPVDNISDAQLRKIHNIATVVAIFGAILKFVDVFVIRGVSLVGSVVERRTEMDSVGANPVSMICAVLLPACLLVPLTWHALRQRGLATRQRTLIAHLLFFVPIVTAAVVAGSRSSILVYVTVYALYALYFGRLRIRIKTAFKLALTIVIITAICTAIFNNRLEAMHLNALQSVYSSGYSFTLQPQEWITQVMQGSSGLLGDLAFSVLMTCQYYLHGVFEFVYQVQNAPGVHIWGAASFNAYYKFLAMLLNWSSPDELWSQVTVRNGIYTTFFGPVFSDFGWLGPLYMLAFGALAQRMWEKCRVGFIGAVPFYMYFVYVIFKFPVDNSVTGSQGLYTLTVFAVFFWLFPRPKRRAEFAGITATLQGT